MKKYLVWGLLLSLLPAAWAQQGGQAHLDKAQRQQLRREQMQMQVQQQQGPRDLRPVAPPQAPPPVQVESPAQRRADLRAALLAKRPPGEVAADDSNKHLTPRERMELRQQLRQQQQAPRQQNPGKGQG